jgi:hypothetical protein
MAKNKNKSSKKIAVKDAFVNPVAKLGLGMDNLISGTDYTRTRITQDYNLMVTLYRTHWIVKKIIDVVANDMTKAGIKITTELEPQLLKRIQNCIKRRKVTRSLNKLVRWGRLFGGAGAVMLIDGQDEILDKPLDVNTIMLNDFKGLLVFDRWSGITPCLTEMVDDLDSVDYGLPKYYNVTVNEGQSIKVHHSRVLRYVGRTLPRWEEEVEQYWGASELEAIIEEIAKRDNTSFNIAQLVFLANLRILKMSDLGDGLTLNDSKAQSDIYQTLKAQNSLMSSFGLYVMNKDDDFDTKAYSFSGLAEIMQQFMLDITGATGIPATKMYGRSPEGMNATGESDMQNYYEMITENQSTSLEDNWTKLLPVICMSEIGYIPDDLDFEFEAIENVKEEEIADLIAKKSDSIIKGYDANLITQKEAREELKEIGQGYDIFSNIDETVKADDTLSNGIPDIGEFNLNPENKGLEA